MSQEDAMMKSTDRADQKLKTMLVMQILMDETDKDHAIERVGITEKLENNYGIHAERKGIYRDLETVDEYLHRTPSSGIRLESWREANQVMYAIRERLFSVTEMKLLIDAINSSRFISKKKARDLSDKVRTLASRYQREQLKSSLQPLSRMETDNRTTGTLNVINMAMDQGREIDCQYCEWNTKGELVPRHKGQVYHLSPWQLYYDDGKYYLIAFDSEEEKIKYFRVDKIIKARLSARERKGKDVFKKENVSSYESKLFNMFGGKDARVHMLCRNYLANVIVDQFGKDVILSKVDEEHFEAVAVVTTSPQFYGWVIGLGDGMTITAPKECVDKLKEISDWMQQKYQ